MDTTLTTFNPFPRASDPKGFGVRQRGSVKKTAPEDATFDLGPAQKALGLPEDLFPQAQGMGGNDDWTGHGLDRQIRLLGSSIDEQRKALAAQTDPFAQAKLQLQGKRAQTDAEIAALAANPPVKQPDYQYTPETPYPVREGLPVPQRPDAKVNPVASLLAGIGGFIAPQGAAQFAGSAIHGAVQRASQTYSDALRTRDMQLADLDRRHSDEVQARNEAIRYAEDNLDRKSRAEYLDAVASGNYKAAQKIAEGNSTAENILDKGYGDLTAQARETAKAVANLQGMEQNRAQLEATQDARNRGKLEAQKMQNALLGTIARFQESKAQHEATAQHNKDMEAINAQNHGFIMQPGQNGQLPSFTPIAKGDLSIEKQARIDELGARTKADLARAAASQAQAAYKNAQRLGTINGKSPTTKALRVEDPRYNALYNDYTAKQRAMQHDNDMAGNAMTPDDQKVAASNRVKQNFTEMKAIKAEMEQRENAYLQRTKGSSAVPGQQSRPIKPSTKAEYDHIPPGTQWIDSQGNVRVKK